MTPGTIRGGGIIKPLDYQKCYNALIINLSPVFAKNPPKEFFVGKMETFLTCRRLAEYLRKNILDENAGRFFEESALKAIYGVLDGVLQITELKMLFAELPNILPLNYPVVEDIRKICINVIPQIANFFKSRRSYKEAEDLNYLMSMLQSFEGYEQKLRS